ncbi:hypothetical protein NHQ30_000255 [Ciborinia camelliae]|nr:hypothetical protein NHQ30_000255 [Ciborinia camelliae]
MLLPTSSPRFSTLPSPTVHISTVLSLQHLLRIADSTSIKWFTSACVYIPSHHTEVQYSPSTRSKIAYQAWKQIHTPQTQDSDDDDEPLDLWEEKYRYSNLTPISDKYNTSTAYPDHTILQKDTPTIPPFWTAEVDSLPRGGEVEWHAHLGICDGPINILNTSTHEHRINSLTTPTTRHTILTFPRNIVPSPDDFKDNHNNRGLLHLVYADTSLLDMNNLLAEGWGGEVAGGSRTGSLVIWFWAFIGAFCGIAIIEGIFHRTAYFKKRGTPLVIASFGAAAILEYNTIDSPLSQPRNAILGQLFASIIGVAITKLFELNGDFQNLRWLAAALAVGVSSAVMGLTNTIHPPAGATALLAATSPEIMEMGWYLIPLVVLGSVLLVATACVVNNLQRTFPIYWWTPHSLSSRAEDDIEKTPERISEAEEPPQNQQTQEEGEIRIDKHRIVVPNWLTLEYEEKAILEVIQTRLQEGLQNSRTAGSDRTLVR